MAVPSNTIQEVSRVGVREDLSDVIYQIDREETPFISNIGRKGAKNTYVEWQTDSLAAANADNKAIQGDDLTNTSRSPTTRVGNHTQIFTKTIGTSTTARAVDTAGRKDEHLYQLTKAGSEIKRDMEKRFVGNYGSVAATNSVAGEAAGALAWLTTNTDLSGAGTPSDGGFSAGTVTAATNGTLRAFTEAQLASAHADAWNAGGKPSMVIFSMNLMFAAGQFTGIADARRETGNKLATIIGGADVYVSPAGQLTFVPDLFASDRDAFLCDPKLWKVRELDPMQRRQLATTGLADRTALYTEATLEASNEAGNAVIRDIEPA